MEHQVVTPPSPHHLSHTDNTPSQRNPDLVQYAYTPDSIWRNRDTFLQGREQIVAFLREKWAKEGEYRLRKELFAFTDDKVRVPCLPILTYMHAWSLDARLRRRASQQTRR
jgi:nuclear transport factor 2 (NTF2) superfamily protein